MYPNLSLEDATVSAWYAHFQDEDADTFEEALKAAMKTGGDFFPSPHRIADALEKLSLKSKNKYAPVNSEGREAQLRADWKDGVVWIVEHKENHKVIAKERRDFVDSGIWSDKNLVKRITHDGVITYHFGEFYPSYRSKSDLANIEAV